MFSFRRLIGADPMLGVEMAATGEVGCLGASLADALAKALLSAGFRVPTRGVLLSLGPVGDKYRFTEEARALHELGLVLYATSGTAEILADHGIPCHVVDKGEAGSASTAIALIRRGQVDLVINLPRTYDEQGRPDGFRLRRAAIDQEIPLFTDLELARAVVRVLGHLRSSPLQVRSWRDYMSQSSSCS
jgi:carbamoyl-phosphate synthase large subunit